MRILFPKRIHTYSEFPHRYFSLSFFLFSVFLIHFVYHCTFVRDDKQIARRKKIKKKNNSFDYFFFNFCYCSLSFSVSFSFHFPSNYKLQDVLHDNLLLSFFFAFTGYVDESTICNIQNETAQINGRMKKKPKEVNTLENKWNLQQQ